MKRLLLLSNSTLPGKPFFQWPEPYVKRFLGDRPLKILFFPFAGVSFGFDEYHAKVNERFAELGYEMESAHLVSDKTKALAGSDAIAVGGGNTFHLLNHLQDGWVDLIKKEVEAGKPYIGWSAGANVATPSIKTTNDMPIVEPVSFDALNLVSFQINPHYTEQQIPNYGGETRPDRIREFLEMNPETTVFGIPEGTFLQVEGEQVWFKGKGELAIFRRGKPVRKIEGPAKICS